MENIRIIDITPDNIQAEGVFCGIGRQFDDGRKKKLEWFKKRYEEGLRIKISVDEDGLKTGMIEYVPGEVCWRTVKAEGYILIHCLEVFRTQTRKGYGTLLLNECLKDSEQYNGVAIVTSGKPWVNDKKFFIRNGFKKIDTAPPYFELLVKQYQEAPLPAFNIGWEDRALTYGQGITVVYSDQCPIVDYALKNITKASKELDLMIKFCKIESYSDAQNAPSPYGTFNIIIDGKFATHRIFDKDGYIRVLKDS